MDAGSSEPDLRQADLGLVRLHLMELSGRGPLGPTGRVVAFANDNVIESNEIGTDLDGTAALGNYQGVRVGAHTFRTIVQFNLISANGNGVILEGPSELDAQVFGNYIGTDLSGTKAIGNLVGVLIDGLPCGRRGKLRRRWDFRLVQRSSHEGEHAPVDVFGLDLRDDVGLKIRDQLGRVRVALIGAVT